MKLFKIAFVLAFLSAFSVLGQETIKHKVTSGETIFGIAKQYKIKASEIYALNPSVKEKSLQLGTILLLPSKSQSQTKSSSEIHTIAKGDTFYGIAKKYGITTVKITEYNPNLNPSDLKVGDLVYLKAQKKDSLVVNIPKVKDTLANESQVENVENLEEDEEFSNDVIHVVKVKETLYRIAKQYDTTILNLKNLNPEVTATLPVGYHLVIKKGSQPDLPVNPIDENEIPEQMPLDESSLAQADFLINTASQYLGSRYRSGGTTAAGFDCSGLMCTTFKEIDLRLPRTSSGQSNVGTKVKRKQAQKGDLIFFATNRKRTISHVGMITEVSETEIKFIHSSTSSGVIISSLNEPYYAKRFVQINRVLD